MSLCTPVPHCPHCGGIIKPDVVLYEESLDTNTIEDALFEIEHADMLIIGGTSLVVYRRQDSSVILAGMPLS